jgi:hypothetical protein
MHIGPKRLADITDLVGIRLIVPDVQSLLEVSDAIRREFKIPLADSRDASSVESAIGALTGVLTQFERLIDQVSIHEKRDIHPFLKRHQYLLFASPDLVFSEVPIGMGTKYRIDFLVQKPDSTYLLVEIENPQARLFIKSGDFSADVNHAIRQVEDWQEWIEANLPTVERSYPGIRAPEALVVIGRDRGLSSAERDRLARHNVNMRGRVMIRTYDDLLRDARAYVRSIRGAFGNLLNRSVNRSV